MQKTKKKSDENVARKLVDKLKLVIGKSEATIILVATSKEFNQLGQHILKVTLKDFAFCQDLALLRGQKAPRKQHIQ